jgi:catechol 2,3-dioxygenase-like lactoylglutathione lyase family enzyme
MDKNISGKPFKYRGVNHVALVCKDMAETTDFYENVLEMPLVRAMGLPGHGQHFFFDCGNGATLAFMYFPNAPAYAPGIASQPLDNKNGLASAIASMNHLAIDVALEDFDASVQRLKDKGVQVFVINHGDKNSSNPTPEGQTWKPDGDTWVRSVYFLDPNGIRMELAACVRDYGARDLLVPPVNAKGEPVTDYKRRSAFV